MKTMLQCDFDGTITEEDVSYLLLDTFADGKWRQLLKDYTAGKMPVGTFNRMAFDMVKADRKTLTDFVLHDKRVKVRSGFVELLDCCSHKDYKFIITSNGLIFYIEAILESLGISGIDIYAAENRFQPDGVKVKYVGPEGRELEGGFKEAYTDVFIKDGYGIIYAGNGLSDIHPARKAKQVFATGDLLELCRETGLTCMPFNDLYDVVRSLEVA